MKTFVPLNLGFPHISWNEILADHQTVIATELLASELDETVLIFSSSLAILTMTINWTLQLPIEKQQQFW